MNNFPAGGQAAATRYPATHTAPVREREAGYPFDYPLGIAAEPTHLDGKIVELRKIWTAVVKHWILIVACVGGCIVAGIGITLLMTPIYKAATTVQIEREATKVLDMQDVQPVEQAMEAERFMRTQIDLIMSRSLAIRVADKLGLIRDDSFLQRMRIKPAVGDFTVEEARDIRRNQVLQTLLKNLSVESNRSSRIVQINFQSPDSALAAKLANSFAENYIGANLDRRFESTAYARDFLERRLAQTKARLEESERQTIAYSGQQQLIDASEGEGTQVRGPRSLTTANLVQLNSAYSTARAERLEAEERWDQARRGNVFSQPEVLANQAILLLTQKRAELSAEYQEKGKVFKADYPTMMSLAAQITELDNQIKREAGNIRSSIQTAYAVARQQEDSLARDVRRLKAATLDEQNRSIRFNILRREADTNRVLYDALLQRYKEIGLAGGVVANNLSIVDRAEPPTTASSPKTSINLALALLGGLLLGLLLAIGRERFDDTVRTPDDLREKIGLPLVGVVPVLPNNTTPAEALADIRSDMSEAYYSIRTSLQFTTSHGVPPTLLVTSSTQSEGKSTTATAIAMSFARIGSRVLIIDGDLRKPSLHRVFALPNEKGFSNVLAGQLPLEEAIQQAETTGLSFLSSGPLPPNPGELLAGPSFGLTLAKASTLFDLVVIDGPPVMGLADAPMIAAIAGGTVFVIEAGRTHRGQAKVAVNRLRETHAHLLGAILTKLDRRTSAYGTDYSYAYSYRYGKDA